MGCTAGRRLVSISLGAAAAATTLAGTATAAPPVASGGQAALTWGPCGPDVLSVLECATLQVPLDYATPGSPTIAIALNRYPADPATREGAILLNPGGPGGSGFDYVAIAGERLVDELGLEGRYDLIGMDPRGVDRSGGLRCIPDEAIDFWLYVDPDDVEDVEGGTTFGEACRDRYGDTMHLYSTENTARDIDTVRAALGDEQLSYLGISYGTYLGAVYATLFPERVRAMVLDSAYEPTGDTVVEQYTTQRAGFEAVFDRWAAWCASSADCAFRADDVAARWDALRDRLDATPLPAPDGREVNNIVLEDATIGALYDDLAWPALAKAVADADAGDGSALIRLADRINDRSPDGTFSTQFQSGLVIRCASGIWNDTPDDPEAVAAQLQAVAPRFAEGVEAEDVAGEPCTDLGAAGIEPIVPSYTGDAPILVVGGLYDPATPIRWTNELAGLLGPNVSVVTSTGDGHGQTGSSSCVTLIAAAVLTEAELPGQHVACAADNDVAEPAVWDQIPPIDGVGKPIVDPTIDLALGLRPSRLYGDAWTMTGDVAPVGDAYLAAFGGFGYTVTLDEVRFDGSRQIEMLAPDGTELVVRMIPRASLDTFDRWAFAAQVVPAGFGVVTIAAYSDAWDLDSGDTPPGAETALDQPS